MQAKNFTVYKSSAGSGKTYTLVKQYLQIVLPHPEKFKNVLAVTFTNKATNEMKVRIIENLLEIAEHNIFQEKSSVKYMLPEIQKITGLPLITLCKNAKKTLEFILHNYNEFAVSTIDGFVHKVIRSFAFDLHLPLNFKVEIDSDDLIPKIIDLLISRVGEDEQLTKTLTRFTESKADDDRSWEIESDLISITKLILNEEGLKHIEKIKNLDLIDFARINDQLNESIGKLESSISGIAARAVNLIKSSGLSHQAFYQPRSGISKYFERISEKDFSSIFPKTHVITTVDEGKWFAGKASEWEKATIEKIKSQLIHFYHELQDYIQEHYPTYIILTEIRKNIYPLAVLNEIEKLIETYKAENELVLISEFNKRIAEVVLSEPVPFIYERIGEKYKHFLVDEFQDTSILQWQNLLPLIENSLAESHFNMVVGDGKQAIYRWRNGEVEQLDKLPEIYQCPDNPVYKQREESLKRNFIHITLPFNYRSKNNIVDFNNDFFTEVSNKLTEQYQSIYKDLLQKTKNKPGGFIHIEFQEENSPFSFAEFNLIRIEKTIAELLAEGYNYSDIAILCRKNDEASMAAANLLKKEIPVVSAESLLLKSSPKIRFLIAMFKILVNVQDRIAQTEIVEFLFKTDRLAGNLHDLTEKFGICKSEENGHANSNQFLAKLSGLSFEINTNYLMNLSVYDICEELIRTFSLNTEVDPYIQFFLDNILIFSMDQNPDLSELLEWWEEKKNKLSIVVPQGMNAVRVMTIHKSKGLEFPVVIFPFAAEEVKMKEKLWIEINHPDFPRLKTALVSNVQSLMETSYKNLRIEEENKSLLDLINLIYVVMTRPMDRMYIFTSLHKRQKNPSTESVPKLIKHYLETKNLWNEDKAIYTFGESIGKIIQNTKSGESYALNQFISNPWRNKTILRMQAPKYWNIEDLTRKQQWGSMIHYLLSMIKTFADIEPAIEKTIAEGILNEVDSESIKQLIFDFISHPDVKNYFRDGLNIKIESEILLPDGHTLRPDRLIFEGNKVTVIDYKTGQREESHHKQIRMYQKILEDMGYSRSEGVLLYLTDKSNPVVKVYN